MDSCERHYEKQRNVISSQIIFLVCYCQYKVTASAKMTKGSCSKGCGQFVQMRDETMLLVSSAEVNSSCKLCHHAHSCHYKCQGLYKEALQPEKKLADLNVLVNSDRDRRHCQRTLQPLTTSQTLFQRITLHPIHLPV